MALIAKETGREGGSLLEAGAYLARCVGVVDLGVQHDSFYGKDQDKVAIIFELPTETIMVDGVEKPRWMSTRYTKSLYEKAKLRKDLEAWRGKSFTPEELSGFDISTVVNVPCMLTIVNVEKNGNTYANIASVSKPMKGMEVPPLNSEPFVFDMDSPDAEKIKAKLPQWMQDLIEKSETWKNRKTDSFEELDDEDEDIPF